MPSITLQVVNRAMQQWTLAETSNTCHCSVQATGATCVCALLSRYTHTYT